MVPLSIRPYEGDKEALQSIAHIQQTTVSELARTLLREGVSLATDFDFIDEEMDRRKAELLASAERFRNKYPNVG